MYATPLLRAIPTAAGASTCCWIVIGDQRVWNPACGPIGQFPTCRLSGPSFHAETVFGGLFVSACRVSAGTPMGTVSISG